MTPILEVCGLGKAFGGIRAVDDVSFFVRRGETLASIARSNHVEVADLARMNGLKPQAKLKPGKRLTLAGTAGETDAKPAAASPKAAARARLLWRASLRRWRRWSRNAPRPPGRRGR